MTRFNTDSDERSGTILERVGRSGKVVSLITVLSSLLLSANVAAQSDGGFCDTQAGQMMGSTVGMVGALVVMMLIIGLLVGAGLEALPLTGSIARTAHRIVGGLFIGIFVLVLGYSFLQFGLGYSVVDTSMACTSM